METTELDFGEDLKVEGVDQIDAQARKADAAKKAAVRDFEDKVFVRGRQEEAKKYANSLFTTGKISEAGKAYERLLPMLEDGSDMHIAVLSNLAAVKVHEWRWKEALDVSGGVLDRRPTHAKAHYRQAQAYRGLRDFEKALAALAKSREATDAGSKAAIAEIDKLESGLKRDVRKKEDEEAEKAAANARKDRRLRELADKNRKKLEANREGAGIALPPSTTGTGGDAAAAAPSATPTGRSQQPSRFMAERGGSVSGNWSPWLQRELTRRLTAEKTRYMLYDEDGWMEVVEVPETKAEVFAQVRTAANGSRALHYEIDCILHCVVAQFRAPSSDPGALSFHIEIALKDVDNATPKDKWVLTASYCKPDDYRPAPRIAKMMETYVKPLFLPYLREQVDQVLDTLLEKASVGSARDKAASAPGQNVAEAIAKERKEAVERDIVVDVA